MPVAACSGGNAAPKPGLPETVIATAEFISTLLVENGGVWLAPFVGLIGAITYDLVNVCAVDPPPVPNFTQNEYLALLESGPAGAYAQALEDLATTIAHYAWFQFCACTTGSVVLPPAINPSPGVGIPPDTTTLCYLGRDTSYPPPQATGGLYFQNADLALLPPGEPHTITFAGNTNFVVYTLPQPPPTSLQFVANIVGGGPGGNFFEWDAICFDSTGAQVTASVGLSPSTAGGVSRTVIGTQRLIPRNAFYAWATIEQTASSFGQGSIDTQLLWTCENTGQQTNCCQPPTDSNVLNLLNSILTAVNGLRPITAFIAGPAHVGLSGSGEFALATNTVALRVDITTPPFASNSTAGDPTFYFDAGYVTTSVASSSYTPQKLVYLSQHILLGQLVDTCHFTLINGTVATITELHAA